MSDQSIDSILFTEHIILLGVLLWAIFSIGKQFVFSKSPKEYMFMIVFKAWHTGLLAFLTVLVFFEAWFVYSFYSPVDLFYYEYFSIAAEILFITMSILSYKGGK